MPSKKTYEYDSFEDDDDDDDLIDFKKLKLKADQGQKTYKIDENTCTSLDLVLRDATLLHNYQN